MVLLIAGITGYYVIRTVERITSPVTSLSSSVETQLAQLLNPSPTVLPDPVTVVREVRSLQRLETIQYSVEKVITAQTGQGPLGFLFGDRLLLVAHGIVIAGVDLGKIEPNDIWTDELGRLYINLPPAELFIVTLDNEQSYVYDRDTGLFTRGELTLETTARRAAEVEIEAAVLEDGILEQARTNAENYLYRLLRSLGFADVIFAEAGDL